MKYTFPKINNVSNLLNAILVIEDADIGGIFKYVGHIVDILEVRVLNGQFFEADVDIELETTLYYKLDNMEYIGYSNIKRHKR